MRRWVLWALAGCLGCGGDLVDATAIPGIDDMVSHRDGCLAEAQVLCAYLDQCNMLSPDCVERTADACCPAGQPACSAPWVRRDVLDSILAGCQQTLDAMTCYGALHSDYACWRPVQPPAQVTSSQ